MFAISLFALAFLATSANAQVLNYWCDGGNNICVQTYYSQRTDTKSSVVFCISAKATGWVGAGIGSGMADADIWVGWNSATNVSVVSDRTSTGRAMPKVDGDGVATLLVNKDPASQLNSFFPTVEGHTTRIIFARYVTPQTASSKAYMKDLVPGQANNFIWAYANTAPADVNSAVSTFGKHDTMGTFSLDFSAPAATPLASAQGGVTGAAGSGPQVSVFVVTFAAVVAAAAVIFA
ncbi:hypothetical protein BJ742DRAFT_810907 [Cladochytrium replicatum]|nr:hypothetical protein BJ742DRAFT_810907 [Cladochytrium replicatum]